MFNRIFQFSVVAAAVLIMGPATASATIFSGNPFADGWLAGGRSTHVGPDPGFPNGSFAGTLPSIPQGGPIAEYQVFSQTTTIIDLSFLNSILAVCSTQCSAWAVGDTIVGLGAVFPTNPTGGDQGSPATVVVKWGVTTSAYSGSSDLLSTNAHRNFDIGEGGLGSVLAELNFGSAAGNAPTAAFQWTGAAQSPVLGSGFIAFRSVVDSQYFRSFEAYLNVTRLNLANPNGANNPLQLYDGNSLVGVRNYTQFIIGPSQETNAIINGVPEPATGLLAAGALLAGWIVRRRRNS